mmetsp:Transcript_25191/g.65391  ORF Transcript_25191/g.65391 Transcript_25191/m.65391 type:complete len:228 (+) Transcript_25191:1043-1726(+)
MLLFSHSKNMSVAVVSLPTSKLAAVDILQLASWPYICPSSTELPDKSSSLRHPSSAAASPCSWEASSTWTNDAGSFTSADMSRFTSPQGLVGFRRCVLSSPASEDESDSTLLSSVGNDASFATADVASVARCGTAGATTKFASSSPLSVESTSSVAAELFSSSSDSLPIPSSGSPGTEEWAGGTSAGAAFSVCAAGATSSTIDPKYDFRKATGLVVGAQNSCGCSSS